MEQGLTSHYRWFYIRQGVLSTILGGLAILIPYWFTLGVEQLVGYLFLASGLLQMVRNSRFRPEFWSTLLIALLQITAGVYLVAFPVGGIATFTNAIVTFFLLDGFFKIFLAFQLKPLRGWFWPVLNALTSWSMAWAIYVNWPEAGFWTLEFLSGFHLMSQGLFQIAVGLATHDVSVDLD